MNLHKWMVRVAMVSMSLAFDVGTAGAECDSARKNATELLAVKGDSVMDHKTKLTWAIDKMRCWLVNFGSGVTYGPNSYLCGYGNVSAVRLVQGGQRPGRLSGQSESFFSR